MVPAAPTPALEPVAPAVVPDCVVPVVPLAVAPGTVPVVDWPAADVWAEVLAPGVVA